MTTVIQPISVAMNATATTATLRTFMSDFYSALAASGLSQRADTGQADPLTLTYTSGAFYHSVWDLDDGGTPIVFRFSWRAFGTGLAQFYGNIGTGTDGAGVLTGPQTEFSALATPGTTAGAANSGYVNSFTGSIAAMQFMVCRIAADGYFYLEMTDQSQTTTSGGCFAFWRRKGFEASGHTLSFARGINASISTLARIKPPHTPGTGASYDTEGSAYRSPIWVPWGRTNSEPAKVNFFPFKVLFPTAATYGHDVQHVVCGVYKNEHTYGDLLTLDLDGNGERTYRVTINTWATGSLLTLAVLWE